MSDLNNLRVLFTEKADSMLGEILKNNGLQESEEEFFSKLKQGKDPKEIIIRDAATTIAKKIISEGKLVELLQKHLEVSKEITEKIVAEIKKNLLPLLRVYPDEKFDDPAFQEKVSEEIFGPESNELERKNQEDEQEEGKREEFRKAKELLLDRIKANAPKPAPEKTPPMPYDKNPQITNVEKNAKNMKENLTDKKDEIISEIEKDAAEVKKAKTVLPQEEKKGPDDYREPIE